MNNLLNRISKFVLNHDEVQRQAGNFDRNLKTEEWRFMREVILVIRQEMANEYFSKTYTRKDPNEKDVIQKTYYNINEILGFLLDPIGYVKKRDPLTRLGRDIPTQRREGNGKS